MEHAPFLRLRPGSVAPLVLTCEHARNHLPVSGGIGRAEREVLRTHRGWDIGAWELTRDVARRLRTSAVGGRWSRLWIDLNRRVDDPTLILPCAGGVELPWNRSAGPDETERRVLACHVPYHLEIDRLILRRLLRGIRPLVLAVHSFTASYEGRIRCFDAGVLYDRHGGAARLLGRSLRRAGFSVRYNQPYSGALGMMYAVERHGSHHGLPCLELEINQELFGRPSSVSRIGAAVAEGVEKILRHS